MFDTHHGVGPYLRPVGVGLQRSYLTVMEFDLWM